MFNRINYSPTDRRSKNMLLTSSWESASTARAEAQRPQETGANFARQTTLTTAEVEVAGNTVFVRHYGQGPAILLAHGFPTFTLIGHDRGGRVSYRMALDHPQRVERLAVFDVIPILEAWSR